MVDDVVSVVVDVPVRSAGGVVSFLSFKVGSGVEENVDEVGQGRYVGGGGYGKGGGGQ